MSYPNVVPKGWIRGEPLALYGNGPKYGLTIPPSTDLQEFLNRAQVMEPDGFVIITFDCYDDLVSFVRFWHEGERLEQVVDKYKTIDLRWRVIMAALTGAKS